MDGRPKKPTGVELIKENMKELTEVIGYLDFSFEKAFTIQEKEFMLAYKVRIFSFAHSFKLLNSSTLKTFKMTSTVSRSTLPILKNKKKRRNARSKCTKKGSRKSDPVPCGWITLRRPTLMTQRSERTKSM